MPFLRRWAPSLALSLNLLLALHLPPSPSPHPNSHPNSTLALPPRPGGLERAWLGRSPYNSLYIPMSPYASLYLPISPYVSLYLPVSPYASLYLLSEVDATYISLYLPNQVDLTAHRARHPSLAPPQPPRRGRSRCQGDVGRCRER